jgi:hypothetical protein
MIAFVHIPSVEFCLRRQQQSDAHVNLPFSSFLLATRPRAFAVGIKPLNRSLLNSGLIKPTSSP